MCNHLHFVFLQVFTKESFREKLAVWITIDDQPFTVVECLEFQQLLEICGVKKSSIPTADTIRLDILDMYKNYQTDMRYKLQVNKIFGNLIGILC